MNGWKKFKLGNVLRGEYYFKARNLREAWARGCRYFNRGFPSSGPGRVVYLSQEEIRGLLPTTQWILDQSKRPKEERYFSNDNGRETGSGWVTVAYGCSNQKLVLPRR